ncbi:MAG: CAP domain-containing protein [Pseudomonadota bacterium]
MTSHALTIKTTISSLAGCHKAPAASAAMLLTLCLCLQACKIVVVVPSGGQVVSEDGFVCAAGEQCEIEVSTEDFDSTFTAVPDQGYTFTRWRARSSALCGNSSDPCYLTTANFGSIEILQAILDSDDSFYLEPVFVPFDLNYWQTTLRAIDTNTFTANASLYEVLPNIDNCDPGTTTTAAQQRALKAKNETRALHKLPAVQYDSSFNAMVQSAALMQIANNYLNHNPGPSDRCYTEEASIGAFTSNLGAAGGNASIDPAQDIFGWVNDNANIGAVMEAGHRRWVLFPELGVTAYGQTFGFSAMKVFGFSDVPPVPSNSLPEFVAVPYENYPYVLVTRDNLPTPWSLSIVPPPGVIGDFNYFQNAVITVTDNDTNKKLTISNRHTDSIAFGIPNFLSWMVNDWQYDTPYTVSITGISMPDGGTKNISYPVMVNRFDLLDLNYPTEQSDSQPQAGVLAGRFNTPTDADSYSVSLNGERRISGTSNFSNQAFFIRVYDAAKNLVVSSDTAFTHRFGFGAHTIVISPCNEARNCYIGTTEYQVLID